MPKLTDQEIQEIYEDIMAIPYKPVEKADDRGRPSKYKDELILDLLHYFNVDPYEKYVSEAGVRHKDACDFPSIDAWCYKKGITDQTYQNWRKVNPRFAEAADIVVLNQRNVLMVNSLHNNYNPNFAALIGRTKFNWDSKKDEESGEINRVEVDADDANL